MNEAFENWWTTYAYPKIQSAPANFILMNHIDDIKSAAQECWVAAWLASKHIESSDTNDTNEIKE